MLGAAFAEVAQERVAGAERQEAEARRARAARTERLGQEAVDDLVDGAVAADRDEARAGRARTPRARCASRRPARAVRASSIVEPCAAQALERAAARARAQRPPPAAGLTIASQRSPIGSPRLEQRRGLAAARSCCASSSRLIFIDAVRGNSSSQSRYDADALVVGEREVGRRELRQRARRGRCCSLRGRTTSVSCSLPRSSSSRCGHR